MSRGGVRQGAGRPKGSLNRATIHQKGSLAEMARVHTEDALATLVDVMQNSPVPSARIASACALLDRGFGKPVSKQEIIENVTDEPDLKVIIDKISVSAAQELLEAMNEVSRAG